MNIRFQWLLPIFPIICFANARTYTHQDIVNAAKGIYEADSILDADNANQTLDPDNFKLEVYGERIVIRGNVMRLNCTPIFLSKENNLLNMPLKQSDESILSNKESNNEFYSLDKIKNNITYQGKLIYKLLQAPQGMVINSSTGQIVWVPKRHHRPETYTVSIIAQDKNNPAFLLTKSIEVKVESPIKLFGYSFFKPARNIINSQKVQESPMPSREVGPNVNHRLSPEQYRQSAPNTSAIDLNAPNMNQKPVKQENLNQNELNKGQSQDKGQSQGQDKGQVQDTLSPSFEQDENFLADLEKINSTNLNYKYNSNDFRKIENPSLFNAQESNEHYQLGPGDKINIKFWNRTQPPQEGKLLVDAKGNISVPITNKTLSLRGQTLQQAQENIRKQLSLGMKNPDVIVTIDELRTMQITIAGESYKPGTYSVPASSTLYNVLYTTGGALKTGSLRNITVKRMNGKTINFDFYQFILKGDKNQDIRLNPGDVIFIPGYENRVTIKGQVRKPAIYELKNNETIAQAIDFAGGIKAQGIDTRIAIQSVKPGTSKRLIDVDIRSSKSLPPLYDGDIVEIASIRESIANKVILEGAVDQPSSYEFIAGMTVSDLINKGRGVLENSYRERADLFRKKLDGTYELIPISLSKAIEKKSLENLILQKDDRLVVYSQEDIKWLDNRNIKLVGAVRKPGTYYRADNMRLKDLLLQAGGLADNASYEKAFIQHFNKDGTVGELVLVNVKDALEENAAHNPILSNKDLITIKTVQEAKYISDQKIEIRGAVQVPGEYYRAANMTLSDLIHLAGGTLPNASSVIDIAHKNVPKGSIPDRYQLNELTNKDVLLKDGDFISIYEDYNIKIKQHIIELRGAVNQPGFYALTHDKETLADVIKRAGGVHNEGYAQGAQLVREVEHLTSKTQHIIMHRVAQNSDVVQSNAYERFLTLSNLSRGIINVKSPSLTPEQEQQQTIAKAAGINALNKLNDDKQKGLDSDKKDKTMKTLAGISGAQNASGSIPNPKDFPPTAVTQARSFDENDFLPFSSLNIRLDLALKDPTSSDNISLKDGDMIVIPKRPTSVTVVGAVAMLSKSILYKQSMSLDYYINGTGGYMEDAATDRIVIIRTNGEVLKATRKTPVQVGDIIFVPSKIMVSKIQSTNMLSEINNITGTFVNAATLLAILKTVSSK